MNIISKDVAKEIFTHVKYRIHHNHPSVDMNLSGYDDFYLHCVNNLGCKVLRISAYSYIKYKKLNCDQSKVSFDEVYDSFVNNQTNKETVGIKSFKLSNNTITILSFFIAMLLGFMLGLIF